MEDFSPMLEKERDGKMVNI